MNPLLTCLRDHPGPWIRGHTNEFLWTAAQDRQRFLVDPVLILCQADPWLWLVDLLAGLALDKPIVVARPDWKAQEQQALQQFLGTVPETPALWIPTGGSGSLSWIGHTGETLLTAAQGFQDFCRLPDSVVVLPLDHVSGLMPVLRSLVAGGTATLCPWSTLPATPEALPLAGSCLSLVPTQWYRLSRDPDWVAALQTCACVLLGGAPLAEPLLQRAIDLGIPLALSYGMTETAAAAALVIPDRLRQGNRSYQPLPHIQIHLAADNHIVLHSAAIPGGSHHTDDVGNWDAAGDLIWLGRASACVNTGGEKVFPSEVEAVFWASGGVTDVWVGGIPDPEWGEKLVAVYVPASLPLPALQDYVREHLAPCKVPKHWLAVTGIPRQAQGKVSRPAMQQWIQAQLP
ncbi:MAG: 2-succinylbenzoate--CoA ligase [Synechococcales cyanobacterium]